MDFKTVIVVLVAYFIRPQDWVVGMSGMEIIKPLMVIAFFAMFSRQRGFGPGSLVRTPVDWLMLVYTAYIVFTAPDFVEAGKGMISTVAFYFVTCQALTTRRRLRIYLNVWLGCILTVAAMAVMSEHGLDLTGAHDITHQVPDVPRLVLNTYLFNNPNSLGHTVVLALPLIYFAFFWRRSAVNWLLGVGLIGLAGYCVYLTQSKGSFVVGFAVIVGSQFIGRRLITQIILLGFALTSGVGLLTQLPRMDQLNNIAQDEAILGRIMAWELARTATKESKTGEGWKQFQATIIWEDEETPKATHSAYVKIGADLGVVGMFFYLALLYSGLRVLWLARCNSEEDERSRRLLFTLMLGYILSAWMIDRAYHLEYFLMLGAISSMHRRLGVESKVVEDEDDLSEDVRAEKDDGLIEDEETLPEEPEPESEVVVLRKGKGRDTDGRFDLSESVEELVEEEVSRLFYWRRFGAVDLLLSLGWVWLVFHLWDYVLSII